MDTQDQWRQYAAAMDKVTGGTCPADLIAAVVQVGNKHLAEQRAALLGAAPADVPTTVAPPGGFTNGTGLAVAVSPPAVDRGSAIREAVVHVRSLPVTCTALTGPVWYGDGWKSALDAVEDFADRVSGQGEPEKEPISSEELARRLNEADVWWTKGITQTWEKLSERLGKTRYRAIAHRMMRDLSITRRTTAEGSEDHD